MAQLQKSNIFYSMKTKTQQMRSTDNINNNIHVHQDPRPHLLSKYGISISFTTELRKLLN